MWFGIGTHSLYDALDLTSGQKMSALVRGPMWPLRMMHWTSLYRDPPTAWDLNVQGPPQPPPSQHMGSHCTESSHVLTHFPCTWDLTIRRPLPLHMGLHCTGTSNWYWHLVATKARTVGKRAVYDTGLWHEDSQNVQRKIRSLIWCTFVIDFWSTGSRWFSALFCLFKFQPLTESSLVVHRRPVSVVEAIHVVIRIIFITVGVRFGCILSRTAILGFLFEVFPLQPKLESGKYETITTSLA